MQNILQSHLDRIQTQLFRNDVQLLLHAARGVTLHGPLGGRVGLLVKTRYPSNFRWGSR